MSIFNQTINVRCCKLSGKICSKRYSRNISRAQIMLSDDIPCYFDLEDKIAD